MLLPTLIACLYIKGGINKLGINISYVSNKIAQYYFLININFLINRYLVLNNNRKMYTNFNNFSLYTLN